MIKEEIKAPNQSLPFEVDGLSGAFMFMKRQVFEKTKGFDPDFFLYSEETEWCFNRIKKEYLILFVPNLNITHLTGGSSIHIKREIYLQSQLSAYLHLYKKRYSLYLLSIIIAPLRVLNLPFIPLMKKKNRLLEWNNSIIFFKLFKYLLLDIPFQERKFNGRKNFLVLSSIRRKHIK